MTMTSIDQRRRLLLCVIAAALTLVTATAANAIPPGGAGPDTPGTSSVVWPTLLAPGEVVHFEVTGYPAGETINIKIDDGLGYSDTAQAGTGVIHMQAIRSDGTVTGSFVLPDDIKPGAHWLRLLASEPILDDAGQQIGVKGFTRRGGTDFTVDDADTVAAARSAGTHGPDTRDTALAALEAKAAETKAATDTTTTGAVAASGDSESTALPVPATGNHTTTLLALGAGVIVLGVTIGVAFGRRRPAST